MDKNSCPPLPTVMDLLLDAICVVDVDGRYVYVSAAFERIFGYTAEEVLGTPMISLVHPNDRERTLAAATNIMAGHALPHFQNRYIRKDGRVVHIMWSARWSEAEQVRIAVAHDISELKRSESMQSALLAISEAAHTAEDLLALFQRIHQTISELLPAANFFVALYDERHDELSFPYFVDEFDLPPSPRKLDSGTLSAQVIRSGKALLLTPTTLKDLPPHLSNFVGCNSLDWLGVPLNTPNGVMGAIVVQSYSGDVRYSEEHQQLLQFVSVQIAAAIERKQNATWLQYVAGHDVLTGLPNRELFHDRMDTALSMARRDKGQLSLLYIDLDHFKQANDTFGHDVGDLLLCEAALRIRECLREADTVGRLGGDEFAALLYGVGDSADAAVVASKIRDTLNQPFCLSGHRLHISSSIGIAVYPDHGGDRKQLMRYADAAMYTAKHHGRKRAQPGVRDFNADDTALA